ncbi:hypothetical protein THAOC_33499 [Thalassiosira oceanica]|uniref:Uncharacterized protein n=1 Tax=Thalassiosira oceanica TaxID=159749 RepID=K0R527_THAOC|nr:hypothetical protein THAOC_33499 [Thalassiosira oceanica]|eukprot:EJK47760.1 hypothetical protein THAOC_33499 [Thalassiosira oceanica]
MYINRAPYSEEIETVNSKVVAVFSSRSAAEAKAEDYFFESLGLEDNGDSDSGYKWSAIEGGGDCNEFDQEVGLHPVRTASSTPPSTALDGASSTPSHSRKPYRDAPTVATSTAAG